MKYKLDRVNRHPERARTERDDLDAVLDAGHHVGTLSTVIDGKPWVVPMLYGRVGDRVIMHGSVGAGALHHVREGAPAALCVCHIDGWVYAHTLFDSSANYRSAVVHGTLQQLDGDEAKQAMTELSERVMPGRAAEVPDHTRKHMAATSCLALDITPGHWTVKIRDKAPEAPPERDHANPRLWTGTLPIVSAYLPPQTAPYQDAAMPVAPSVLDYIRTSGHPMVQD